MRIQILILGFEGLMTLEKNLNPPQFGPYQIAGLLHSE